MLSEALGSTLPAGMVTVERKRAWPIGWPAGRDRWWRCWWTKDRELELRQAGRGVTAQVRQVVRGVVIARQDVSLDDWVQALAAELAGVAQRDAAAADALRRLMGT